MDARTENGKGMDAMPTQSYGRQARSRQDGTNQILLDKQALIEKNSDVMISSSKTNDYINYLKDELTVLKKEIQEKNQMLESANYKVGRLESINSINLQLIGEAETNKTKVLQLASQVEYQEKDMGNLKVNFYIAIGFSFLIILIEIYLFSLVV
jgi:hypothetical protein